MALARLVLKNLQHKIATTSSSPSPAALFSCQRFFAERITLNSAQKQSWWGTGSEFQRWISSAAGGETLPEEGKEVEVASHREKKPKLFSRSKRPAGRRSLWRRDPDDNDFRPALSGLGNALMQATENINRILGKLSPSRLLKGRVKEQDDCYKLKYYVPGLSKEDVKVMVEDGILRIKGTRVEEETTEDRSDDDDDEKYWSGLNYFQYYDAGIMLPEDAKVDEIKAEMKNGVLNIVIPRDEKAKKDVKEIHVSS